MSKWIEDLNEAKLPFNVANKWYRPHRYEIVDSNKRLLLVVKGDNGKIAHEAAYAALEMLEQIYTERKQGNS